MNNDWILGAVALIIIFILEGIFPYFSGRSDRLKHGFNHLILAAVNGITNFLFGLLVVRIMLWTREHSLGLLNYFFNEGWNRGVLGFLLFDLWMYTWHRINHEWRFFWIFHRTHHTDIQMDSTTALRFHPIEILISNILNLGVFIILGLSINELVFYKMILLPVILFHHSNINLPESFDRILRAVTVTPNMHRVHHSWERTETDSNYSSVFSFWDRLFGSFRLRKDPSEITFGLDKYREPYWQNIKGIVLTPFRSGDNI